LNILLISKEGDGLGVAHRLQIEGNDVSVWIKDERYERALKGIVDRVSDWRPAVASADCIIVDMVGFGRMVPDFGNVPVLGASAVVDNLELDRQFGIELFRRAGVDYPETRSFPGPSSVELPEPWGLGWVIKPCGNKSTNKTLIVRDEELWDHCIRATPDGPLIVQRIVEGVEVSTEGWFNGKGFIRPFNHTFEEKRFLNGNLGCNTGCMGNVVLGSEGNRLTRATVEKFAPFLRMIDYRGPFDINCIVNERGAYALEVTGRMGYDAVEALAELLDEPLTDLVFETAAGVRDSMELGSGYGIAVRLSVPPWPMQNPDRTAFGEPVLGIDDKTLPHLFLTDVYREGARYLTAAGDGIILKATARHHSVSIARKRVYSLLENIRCGSKQYRTDIGERVLGDAEKLKGWGWI
jgi:phosphoribosylamine--glycine ligase